MLEDGAQSPHLLFAPHWEDNYALIYCILKAYLCVAGSFFVNALSVQQL